jgi:hypothetical protein
MSAESKNVRDSLAEQLSSFDNELHATSSDMDMVAGIREGIGRLLQASGNNEAEIRQVLQDQYDSGSLRKETFQLVKSMLDRYSSENTPTSPDQEEAAPQQQRVPPAPAPAPAPIDIGSQAEDQFGATTVIPADFMPQHPTESHVQVGSLLRDRFLLQEKISGGSMGVVYKAMDRRLAETGSEDHWVAIKVLSPKLAENGQALRALQQEAAKGRCLVHPNIVRFVDLDRDDNLYFLIMEWLDGRTLADILDSKDASVIDNKAAFRIVRQIGDALDYAHSRGIVHADIKPGNIMIMPNGDAKLFDFGVARVRQQHSDAEFNPGVLGALTPAYSSMQVLTGEEPVAADDVFSLSCLLYRLIAGYRVFGPRNAAEASQEGMKPQRLKGLNDSQWRALKKGLSNSRVTRFSSVRDLVDALEEHEEEPFRVEEPDRFVEADDHSAVGKWVVVVLLLAGLAAGAGYQYGYLDKLIERFAPPETVTPTVAAPDVVLPAPQEEKPLQAEAESEPEIVVAEPEALPEVATSEPEAASNAAVDELQVEPEPEPAMAVAEPQIAASEEVEQTETVSQAIIEEAPAAKSSSMLVDFSTLPPPTEVIPFSPRGGNVKPVNIAVREGSPPVIIDFVRGSGLSVPMTLRLEEFDFSGSRSPWESGEYALSNSGLIHFPAGQARGRVSLTVASDARREEDQQSTLRLRDAGLDDVELAVLNVKLEDDDRRSFEARLPRNTVSFASSKISVSEADTAVQIDLVRFNPDNSRVDVSFIVSDLSADDGRDYFGPSGHSISFGPGQRSARLLIPLVQDAEFEGDETFVVELVSESNGGATGVDQHIVVTIRDDDPRTP